MYGPIYDIETDTITLFRGTREQLLAEGVKEKKIVERFRMACNLGELIRYDTIRRKIKADSNGDIIMMNIRIRELNDTTLSNWADGTRPYKMEFIDLREDEDEDEDED